MGYIPYFVLKNWQVGYQISDELPQSQLFQPISTPIIPMLITLVTNTDDKTVAAFDKELNVLQLWGESLKLKAEGKEVNRVISVLPQLGLSLVVDVINNKLSWQTNENEWAALELTSKDFGPLDENSFFLSLPTPLGSKGWSILPGRLELSISNITGGLHLAFSKKGQNLKVSLAVAAEASAEAVLRLNAFWKESNERWLGLPIQAEANGAFAFEVNATIAVAPKATALLSWEITMPSGNMLNEELKQASAFLDGLESWTLGKAKDIKRSLEGFADRTWFENRAISNVTFKNPMLRGPDGAKDPERTQLVIYDLGATINIGNEKIELTNGTLALDKHLCVITDASKPPLLSYEVVEDTSFIGGKVKLTLLKGASLQLCLDPRDPYFAISKINDSPAMQAFFPADADTDGQQFIFDFDADDPVTGKFCRIGPDGARMKATLRERAINLGIAFRDVRLEGGFLQIDRSRLAMEVTASARLGYFERATGRLTVRAASGDQYAVVFEPKVEGAWTDPSGCLEFLDPGLVLSLTYNDKKWIPNGSVSGTLRFKPDCALLQDAAEWLDEIVGSMELRFEKLDLNDFFNNSAKAVRLRFHNLGKSVKLWKVLKLELLEFELDPQNHSVVLGGNVHVTLEGGCYFMAGMSGLKMKLGHGASISLAEDEIGRPLTLRGALTTPAGLRAKIELKRERNAARQTLAGVGTLKIPGWSGVTITTEFGRSWINTDGTRLPDPTQNGKWIAIFFLFVEADIPITIYPGVVLRDLGLGFGINKQLRGLDNLRDEKAFDALMQDPRGLPNPAALSDWEDAGSFHHTDVAVVARTLVTTSAESRGPFPYVADATLYVKPTGDFTFAFLSNVWLFSSLDAVRKPEYRSRPLMQTVMVMYPRHGYIEARSRTRRDFLMEAVPEVVSKPLGLVESEFMLKASPDMFRLRMGPMKVDFKMLGFQLEGSLLHSVELSSGTALMLFHQQLSGTFDFEAGFRTGIGIATISAGLRIHAKAGYSILFVGGFIGEGAGGLACYGRARAWISFEVSVWVSIDFRISFKVLWKRVTISWSVHASASLSLSVDAEIEMLIGTSDQALRGHCRIHFSMCGFDFSPNISFAAGRTDALDRVRDKLAKLLPENYLLIN